ncbi:hypothetical protein [Streptomyces daghestanicus]|uniref:Uncharacterized protein n=1 Tax=Streptomyces daghestanicus TaxID=66885 RepID=A0ABQ3Q7T0_9ACTN|nr:hypothetical protein [Streptomyces daghestanicus]GGU62622.1 hypothetical protein GCM10010259_61580 [Streptomyces daghestanicus]GHI33312.1 hypothetical protein Sdagh_50420 [Streptomyces daghestanicus]
MRLSHETYRRMTSDERTVRAIAGKELAEHAPSNRTDPTCTGCDGAPWPCAIAKGAMKYVDPRYN